MFYAGIGSRETPDSILRAFETIGESLANMDIILRSGRAPGADSAFEKGARRTGKPVEIYIPWNGFPKGSDLTQYPAICFDTLPKDQRDAALASVRKYHPAPDRLSAGALKLMARNYCQMFGSSVQDSPSSFVVCYTVDGNATGGTGQAMRMAADANIPILNAHSFESNPDQFVQHVLEFIRSL